MPTVSINTKLSICGTVSARTCKSGSATVIATPSIKLTTKIKTRFFDFVKEEPIFVPIGVIEISAPKSNKPIPTIIITAPIKKDSKSPDGNGAILKHNKVTITTMGRTESAELLIFSPVNTLFLLKIFFILIARPSFPCNLYVCALSTYNQSKSL